MYAASKGLTNRVPDELHLKAMFRATIGKRLDLDNPVTFNEKLQWLKIHDRNPLYTTLVDKYRVKQWVADRIGTAHVTETYAMWERAEDIDISALPERFVLKTNHDSGGVAICRDRATFDFDAARKKLAKHLKTNYFWGTREWPYKDVKPCVFAEEYLDPEEGKGDLTDYKLMCFGGKVRCEFTCTDRADGDLHVDFFDTDWNHLPFTRHYPNADVPPEAPARLKEMVADAEGLSSGIPFVRADFYEVAGQYYFGEMTFFPGGGFEEFDPKPWDDKLGSWIELPESVGGGVLLLSDSAVLLLRTERSWKTVRKTDLYDYKLFRFSDGRLITLAMTDRFTGGALSKTFFDDEWHALPVSESGHPTRPELKRPASFEQMKAMADCLGEGFPFVRVDFYESAGSLYFGEMTFYPNSGFEHFEPSEWDRTFGSWIDLKTLGS